jgi:hypothetical protein
VFYILISGPKVVLKVFEATFLSLALIAGRRALARKQHLRWFALISRQFARPLHEIMVAHLYGGRAFISFSWMPQGHKPERDRGIEEWCRMEKKHPRWF